MGKRRGGEDGHEQDELKMASLERSEALPPLPFSSSISSPSHDREPRCVVLAGSSSLAAPCHGLQQKLGSKEVAGGGWSYLSGRAPTDPSGHRLGRRPPPWEQFVPARGRWTWR